jgi:iron complex transport system substrate-binding protein
VRAATPAAEVPPPTLPHAKRGADVAPPRFAVFDDEGALVHLPGPALRIISLAPHTTELLYAAGAGAKLMATVRYADFPEAAKRLPLVGDARSLDLERIAAFKPDLIVAWSGGSSPQQMAKLRSLGVPIFQSSPRTLPQIADSLRRLGTLAGTQTVAERSAVAFESELASLKTRYSQRPPVRVFYQVWPQPLMTLNRDHLISEVMQVCGGVNVFAPSLTLVPTVSREEVLAAHPQVLAAAVQDAARDASATLAPWKALRHFEPTARGQVILLPGDLISRQGPRILQGTRLLCTGLEAVREHSQ